MENFSLVQNLYNLSNDQFCGEAGEMVRRNYLSINTPRLSALPVIFKIDYFSLFNS